MTIELKRDLMCESPYLEDGMGPDLRAMDAQMEALKRFRDEGLFVEADWRESVELILDFQREDGSFSFVSDYHIPSDARVDYLYRPSYACCQILSRVVVAGQAFDARILDVLERGLAFCCTRNLVGHGHDGLRQQIEDVMDFARCEINALRMLFPGICPGFFELLDAIGSGYECRARRGDVFGDWGEYLAPGLMGAASALGFSPEIPVFVYGTLMTGMPNEHFVRGCSHLGEGWIEGYTMYDLGSYPGILPCDSCQWKENTVRGEVRLVDAQTLMALDRLEGEGSLYRAKRVTVHMGFERITALAYVYMHEPDFEAEIPSVLQPYSKYVKAKGDLVWYVSYGANMLRERFMTMVEGGTCPRSGVEYAGCSDKTPPVLSVGVFLPYVVRAVDAQDRGAWFGSDVVLDADSKGSSFGRAYLITRGQYEQIRQMEQRKDFYCDQVGLGSRAGIPMVTLSSKVERDEDDFEIFDDDLQDVMHAGLREAFFRMPQEVFDAYLSEIE